MTVGSRVSLTLGFANHAALKALADKTVEPDGIDLTCVTRFPEPWMINLTESILSGRLDGGEFSASFFIQARSKGAPVVGIPVFPYRSFRHRSIYRRDGSGIERPADLKGKRIGLHAYSATTMIWARGILRDEFGIHPQDIEWYTLIDKGTEGAIRSGVRIHLLERPAEDVDYLEHLAELIQCGELDGGICPRDISRPGVSPLFPDYRDVEAGFYRRTGIFPIIHTIALNAHVLQEHPWARASLFEALQESAALAPQYLAAGGCEHFDDEMWGVDRDILGGKDPYQCGLGSSERRTIEALTDYLLLDRAISVKPPLEELYPPL